MHGLTICLNPEEAGNHGVCVPLLYRPEPPLKPRLHLEALHVQCCAGAPFSPSLWMQPLASAVGPVCQSA